MALRLDLTPSSFTLIQFCFPCRSLRSSDGGSFRLTMSTSTSPSLSKSPKAHPRLQCAAATPGPGLLLKLLEGPVAEIAKDGARRLVRILRELALHLGVDVAGHHEKSGMAVVVEVDDPGAPADVARLHAEPRRPRHVVEVPLAVVVVEAVGVVGEMRLEEVEVPVEVVVADPHPHPRLLRAVLAERDAPQDALLAERSVMVVDEQQAGRGIAGDVDVRPPVFVQIGGDDGHAVALVASAMPACWLTSVNVPSPLLR